MPARGDYARINAEYPEPSAHGRLVRVENFDGPWVLVHSVEGCASLPVFAHELDEVEA